MPWRPFAFWRRIGWPSRIGLTVLTAFAGYTAFGFLVLPLLAESVVVSRLTDALGRSVAVEDIGYNPYTHRLTVSELAIREKDADSTFVSIGRVDADVSLFSLIKLAGVMEEVSILEPAVFIQHKGEGVYNFSDLLERKGERAEAVEENGTEERDAIFPFVVNNFQVRDGRVVVWDQPRDMIHSVEAINISVPYTSSLPEDRLEPVTPSLSAIINGKRFKLTGETRPFADKLTTEFTFSLWGENLVKLWPYLPAPPGVSLARGLFSCSAVLAFERAEGILPKLSVRGDFHLDDISLRGPDGNALAGFESLAVKLRDFSLAERMASLESILLSVPYAHLTRLEDGRLDWLALAQGMADGREEPASAAAEAQGEPAPAFRVAADTMEIERGFFRFTDRSVRPGFETMLAPLDLRVENLDTSPGRNATFVFTLGTSDGIMAGARGVFSPVPPSARAECNVTGVVFRDYRAYYEKLLPLVLASGRARTSFTLSMPPGQAPDVEGLDLEISGTRLDKPGGGRAAGFDLLAVRNATVSLSGRRAEAGRVLLSGARVDASRTRNGKIDLAELFAAGKDGASARREEAQPESKDADAKPFEVLVREVALKKCSARFTDYAVPGPARFRLDNVDASLKGVRSDLAGNMPLAVRAVFQKTAGLAVRGTVRIKPGLKASLDLDLRGLPLEAGLPYLPSNLPAKPASGLVSAKGRAEADAGKTLSFAYKGDVSLDRLLVRHGGTGKRLAWLDWLAVQGLDARGPEIAAKVREVRLAGFRVEDMHGGGDLAGFADLRVRGTVFSRPGRSLRVESVDLDAPFALIVKQADATNVGRTAAALKGDAPAEAEQEQSPPEPEKAVKQAEPPGGEPAMDVSVGVARISRGTFVFKDETVTPAFTADFGNVTARAANLSLTPGETAVLSLNATFADQAPLLVDAGFDPTLSSMDSDVRVSVRNYSMTGLSPYTSKHVSHPIETGKLRADVRLNIRGDALDGDNSFFIEKFELGPDVDSPDDIGVPMGLALALLRDMDGNVALDVPVSGDLSDPEFSLGGVVVNAIVNLLTKIVTSPFAALGSMFGGGEEDSYLAFAPGSAELDSEARVKLDHMAEALAKRPGLTMEVAGYVDPATDVPALEQDLFTRRIKRGKYLEMKQEGNAPAKIEDVVLSKEEYPDYLERAYLESDAPKETNFLGMVKVPEAPEMERALKKSSRAGKGDLLELATERARAARSYLTERGVEPERLFIKYGTFDNPSELEGAPPARAEFLLK